MNEPRATPEENEAQEGRRARMDRAIYHRLLTDLCSLILGSAVPIGPMRSRDDYPHELAKAVKFLHEIRERENRADSSTNDSTKGSIK